VVVELLDGAADAGRCAVRRRGLSERRHRNESGQPMALIGGIFALVLTGTPFSVSAAIGFVGLFGISVMEGIIILSYFIH
jgi:hypothetical protein